MGIGKRIREAREAAGLKQKELGEMIGVTGAAIANYENEVSHPKELILYALFDALNIDANFLFQDMVKNKSFLSLEEQEHIKKNHTLDGYGKRAVDAVLDIEAERCQRENESRLEVAARAGDRREQEVEAIDFKASIEPETTDI